MVTTLRAESCWIHALPGVAVTMQARIAKPFSSARSRGISTKAERAVLPPRTSVKTAMFDFTISITTSMIKAAMEERWLTRDLGGISRRAVQYAIVSPLIALAYRGAIAHGSAERSGDEGSRAT